MADESTREFSPEFQAAVMKVVRHSEIEPLQLENGNWSQPDLVAVGVQRKDIRNLLFDMFEGTPIEAMLLQAADEFDRTGDSKTFAALMVALTWAVEIGVWLERARWQEPPSP